MKISTCISVIILLFLLSACESKKAVMLSGSLPMITCNNMPSVKRIEYKESITITVHAVKDISGNEVPDSVLMKYLVFTPNIMDKGYQELIEVLKGCIRYPAFDKDAGITGTVIYTCRVLKTGTLTDPLPVTRTLGYSIDREVTRCLCEYISNIKVRSAAKFYAVNFVISFDLQQTK
jgi:hypothetical protein